MGVAVAAVTYDSVSQNASFSSENELKYPLLSDREHQTVKDLGILNEQFESDHFAYGVSHPGVFLLDSNGKIVMKRSEEQYSKRPDFSELIDAVGEALSEDSSEEPTESESENQAELEEA